MASGDLAATPDDGGEPPKSDAPTPVDTLDAVAWTEADAHSSQPVADLSFPGVPPKLLAEALLGNPAAGVAPSLESALHAALGYRPHPRGDWNLPSAAVAAADAADGVRRTSFLAGRLPTCEATRLLSAGPEGDAESASGPHPTTDVGVVAAVRVVRVRGVPFADSFSAVVHVRVEAIGGKQENSEGNGEVEDEKPPPLPSGSPPSPPPLPRGLTAGSRLLVRCAARFGPGAPGAARAALRGRLMGATRRAYEVVGRVATAELGAGGGGGGDRDSGDGGAAVAIGRGPGAAGSHPGPASTLVVALLAVTVAVVIVLVFSGHGDVSFVVQPPPAPPGWAIGFLAGAASGAAMMQLVAMAPSRLPPPAPPPTPPEHSESPAEPVTPPMAYSAPTLVALSEVARALRGLGRSLGALLRLLLAMVLHGTNLGEGERFSLEAFLIRHLGRRGNHVHGD